MASELRWQMRWRASERPGVTAGNADRGRGASRHCTTPVPDPRFALSAASPGSRQQRLLHLGVLSGEADQITAGGSGTGEGSPSGQGRVSPMMYIVKLST